MFSPESACGRGETLTEQLPPAIHLLPVCAALRRLGPVERTVDEILVATVYNTVNIQNPHYI